MKRTKEEMSEMTDRKRNSKKTVERLVMDELLEMGFSYNQIGTHYLHDSIVYSTTIRLEGFKDVNKFCQKIGDFVRAKYGVGFYQYANNIERSIESAFSSGNINYLLETFKSSYDYEKMKVTKNTFIMTVRKKILESLENQNSYNATQLRVIIQGELEEIRDIHILQGMCDIVLSLKGNKACTIN